MDPHTLPANSANVVHSLAFLDALLELPDDYRWKSGLCALSGSLANQLLSHPDFPQWDDVREQLQSRADSLLKSADYQQWLPDIDKLMEQWKENMAAAEAAEAEVSEAKRKHRLLWREKGLAKLSNEERLVLLLALAPHLYAGSLDQLLQPLLGLGTALPELGGVQGTAYRGLLPTGDTALFLLGGTYPAERARALANVLAPGQPLLAGNILRLGPVPAGEPRLSGVLLPDPDLLEFFLSGYQAPAPAPAADFPAQPLRTSLTWQDLVLPRATRALVDDMASWLQYAPTLRDSWGLGALAKPGYRALFYGPSGTGKTLTATLLGQQLGRTVYRVDLSMVLSKYIGETEKSLARLFEQAQAESWILFFDEADALFGKRTETRDAHDRFANQEVAYLLQKVEEYDGLVILATNLKGNIDAAFSRRFQAMVPFPMPAPTERKMLWERTVKGLDYRAAALPLEQLAARYELTGASILNVVQFAALRALGQGADKLTEADVVEGIRLEYQKDGKLL